MTLNCGGKIGRLFLMSINIVFMVIGLGLLVVGALMKSNVLGLKDDIKAVLNGIVVNDWKLGNLVGSLTIIFIFIGVFLFLVAFLGFFGAFFQNRCVLVTYAVLVLLLLLMKIAVIILWYIMKNGIENEIKSHLLESLKTKFVDDSTDGGNDISNAWNIMFMSLDCCGVNPVNSTTNDFDQTTWCTTKGDCQETNADIPKTCCIGVTESTYKSAPTKCYYSLQRETYNKKGCYQAIKDLLNDQITDNAPRVLAVAITISLLEVFAIISAFVVGRQSGKNEKLHTSKPI
ncbi:CD63 antigen-like isoform X2 [Ostrea edulis]|uniref:CD63 antigen-like isoform X2 n=1 Tax=Ostrea edulis TaxID=37623 RepID=UPI0024AFE079|nr:CD63 antigen-like isoform X2 [Ostrea edulis]XP_056012418.1 CD63 antigen-like isoform X2 [Ostrea edulis]